MSSRESIRLAFVAGVPATCRLANERWSSCVEVLSWLVRLMWPRCSATTAPAVNSALQRARAALAAVTVDADVAATLDEDEQKLVRRATSMPSSATTWSGWRGCSPRRCGWSER